MDRPSSFKIFFFQDYEAEKDGLFLNSPGLLPFIGYLRSLSFDIELMLTRQELVDTVQKRPCELVAFSSMERRLPETVGTAMKVKALIPKVPMVIGGVTIAPYAEDLAADLFDIVVTVEGENVFPALLYSLMDSRTMIWQEQEFGQPTVFTGVIQTVCSASPGGALDPDQIDRLLVSKFVRQVPGCGTVLVPVAGVYVRDSARGRVFKINGAQAADRNDKFNVKPEPTTAELADQTIVPWDIVEEEKWKHFEFYAQRGCRWGQCSFCSLKTRGFRAVGNEKILEILDQAKAHRIETISFADDVFVHSAKRTKRLLEEIKSRNMKIPFRAQTIPDRKIWPLLDLMHDAGFVEVAYGVETFDPERAEFMKKTLNGVQYIRMAEETVMRTALSGICPTIYLIIADPESTLASIARELGQILDFGLSVFESSGILPRFSSSLVMLPLKNTWMSEHYPYDCRKIQLPTRTINLPNEFIFKKDVSAFIRTISQLDRENRADREDLSFFETCFQALAKCNKEVSGNNKKKIGDYILLGLERYRTLTAALDDYLEEQLSYILHVFAGSDPVSEQENIQTRLRRVDSYKQGIHELIVKLNQYIRQGESQSHSYREI